jgi:hypothetical protein
MDARVGGWVKMMYFFQIRRRWTCLRGGWLGKPLTSGGLLGASSDVGWVGGLDVYENGSNIYIIIQHRRKITMSARGARINRKETDLNLACVRNSVPAWGCQRLHRCAPTECDKRVVSRLVSAHSKGSREVDSRFLGGWCWPIVAQFRVARGDRDREAGPPIMTRRWFHPLWSWWSSQVM